MVVDASVAGGRAAQAACLTAAGAADECLDLISDDSDDFESQEEGEESSTRTSNDQGVVFELSDDEAVEDDPIEDVFGDEDVVDIAALEEFVASQDSDTADPTAAAMAALQPGDEKLDVADIALKYAFGLQAFRGDQKVRLHCGERARSICAIHFLAHTTCRPLCPLAVSLGVSGLPASARSLCVQLDMVDEPGFCDNR
jgi:hypothetical protein